MTTNLALNSAADLGNWLREELTATRPDVNHMLRVIARETDRWFLHNLDADDIAALASEPVNTGNRKWDALVEGVVAYRLHIAGLRSPRWTRRTRLDEGWNPREDTDNPPPLAWSLLDLLETPAELFDKGVNYSYRNMELL